MFRIASLLLVLALPPAAAAAPPAPLDGSWQGTISVLGMELAITVRFSPGSAGLAASIDIPQQMASGLPLAGVTFEAPHVRFELPAAPGTAVFAGELRGDEITGSFTQGGATGTFRLRRQPVTAEKLPYRETEVSFETGAGSFACTLTLPAQPASAVALLSGSGAQNRDEEILGFKPFRLLADHLSRHTVAVLRCDDRGVGGTTAPAALATTSDLADDAVAAVGFLRSRPELAKVPIGLVGHSEGGVTGPLAATRSNDIAFLVLLSPLAVTGERVLLDQGALIGRAAGASEEDVKREGDFQRRLFQAVRAGNWQQAEREMRGLAKEQVARLPEAERKALGDLDAYVERAVAGQLGALQSPWFKFFLDYDPAQTLKDVRCPVLALFGEKDLQVPTAANRGALAAALAAGGNSRVTTLEMKGANHLYQPATTGSPREYATLPKEFVPDFLPTVTRWIEEQAIVSKQ